MEAVFFETSAAFRAWLEENHTEASELLVGYYKVGSDKPSMRWSESVDQALCFGWIDGVRKTIDDERYCIRFTPRKPKSIWSAVNIKKIEALKAQGLMHQAGLDKYAERDESRSRVYAYENKPAVLSEDLEKQFRQHPEAWTFFQAQAPSYQKRVIYWLMGAKQEATQQGRLTKLIATSEEKKRI